MDAKGDAFIRTPDGREFCFHRSSVPVGKHLVVPK